MMDEQLQDRIDQYILGQMSDADRAAFEQDLAHDDALREQYHYTRMVKDAVSEQAELEQLMDQWDEEIVHEREDIRHVLDEYLYRPTYYKDSRPSGPVFCGVPEENEPHRRGRWDEESFSQNKHLEPERVSAPTEPCIPAPAPAPKKRRKLWIGIMGVAALLIVALWVTHPFAQDDFLPQNGQILPEAMSRDAGDLNEIQQTIMARDYAKALVMIEQARSATRPDETVGQPVAADSLDEEWKAQQEYEQREIRMRLDDLSWLRVYALLGLERRDEAKSLLDSLRTSGGYYCQKADSLYRKLD